MKMILTSPVKCASTLRRGDTSTSMDNIHPAATALPPSAATATGETVPVTAVRRITMPTFPADGPARLHPENSANEGIWALSCVCKVV
ncbi:hypothetical protein GA0070216_115118 [Micromonospora matsumotoense]|uniref:Uncharacterized protein n=1 Tax=Micromonospora matsumotoense TaxID=121616 RepID=A0A1C5ACF3_9ACTN|nr:hypothetical protein GA0070216_115118 [Micromonospora matsumotoense]